MKTWKPSILLTSLLVIMLGACSGESVGTPATTTTDPTQAPTPAPTQAILPPPTPQPSPTLSIPDPLMDPVEEEVLERYRVELRDLHQALLDAHDTPASSDLPPEFNVALFPLDERLYYLQTLLYPETVGAEDLDDADVYVVYDVWRGEDLYLTQPGFGEADTQEVIVDLRVIVKSQKSYFLAESLRGAGGCRNALRS
jgi:hypothetical protein